MDGTARRTPSASDESDPWGPGKAPQSTVISEHPTAAAAFAEIDRLASEMVRTGAPSDAIELLVIDPAGVIVRRSARREVLRV